MSSLNLDLAEIFTNFVNAFEIGGFSLTIFILFVALVSFILGKSQASNKSLLNNFANSIQKLEGVFGKLQRIENSLNSMNTNTTRNLELIKEQVNKSYERIKKIHKRFKSEQPSEEDVESISESNPVQKLFEDTIIQDTQENFTQESEKEENETKESFWQRLKNLRIFSSTQKLDLKDVKERLLSSDCGVELTEQVLGKLNESFDSTNLKKILESFLIPTKLDLKSYHSSPRVFLFVGVNGVGKTSTVAKLAHKINKLGGKVLTVAADTFRAGAEEQLLIWSKKIGVPCFANPEADKPQTVVFDAIKLAISEKFDFVLIDTAGRLHNKSHLMQELAGIKKVISKQLPNQPEQIFLVLDATAGQTAFSQAKEFLEIVNVSSIILTKLDCAAKGGFIFRISRDLKIPITFISAGEDADSLLSFDPNLFVSQIVG